MLVQEAAAKDGTKGAETFARTELFQKCRAMGIIPASQEALDRRDGVGSSDAADCATAVAPAAREVAGETLTLRLCVDGMWCPACGWVIAQTLSRLPGVVDAACRFSTDTLRCRYDPAVTSPRIITERIQFLGYGVRSGDAAEDRREDRSEFVRFAVSAFLTMNIMMLSFAVYAGFLNRETDAGVLAIGIPAGLMAGGVFFYGGRRMLLRALRSLPSGAYGMETLVGLGVVCAFGYSAWNLAKASPHLYFDTSAMLVTLVLLGKLIERRAKRDVQADLAHFFSLQPKKVRLFFPDQRRDRYVSADYLAVGDLFLLEAGEVAPADGTVVEGRGLVDHAALTGEPRPEKMQTGDSVAGGTRLVNGRLVVRATRVGADATLGQMIALIEKALGRKHPMEAWSDRALRFFVPVVVGLAAVTGIWCLAAGMGFETAMLRFITVLVISCPCALGIAIPLARVAGVSAAGRAGILVRETNAFETAGDIDTIVFDKTGTLTEGRWQVSGLSVLPPHSEAFALSLAAGLEADSDHATALAVTRFAKEKEIRPLPVTDIQSAAGGRRGCWNGDPVRIGGAAFVFGEEMPVLPFPASDSGRGAGIFHSSVYLCLAEKAVAVFRFEDRLRPEIPETTVLLRRRGYTIGVVSGDASDATGAVARRIGAHLCEGGRRPRQKMRIVADLQAAGHKVAMVGDGVNDAPALSQADLAVAVKAGSPLGKEAAHITLMRGEVSQLIDFLDLAKRVRRKIRQNFGFTIVYNLVCIPVAMAGWLTPLVAVCAMLASSLSVIGNTMLLVRKYRVSTQSP